MTTSVIVASTASRNFFKVSVEKKSLERVIELFAARLTTGPLRCAALRTENEVLSIKDWIGCRVVNSGSLLLAIVIPCRRGRRSQHITGDPLSKHTFDYGKQRR
jgi:hypothetical protein